MAESGGTPIPAGTWVEVGNVVLAPGERAPQVPEETERVPLEMRVKGFLARDAALGEETEVITLAGRRLRGVLRVASPAYTHSFGPPVPELLCIGRGLRALLERGEEPA